MSLALNELKLVSLHSNTNTISKHAPHVKELMLLYAEQPIGSRKGATHDEKSHSSKDKITSLQYFSETPGGAMLRHVCHMVSIL